jgi:ribosomal-protein-alanine N-acetyltransferase
MISEEKISIHLTTDPRNFSVCALMMAGSDPWITLELDYDNCLKAFDGQFREIWIIEADDNIAGFVILQMGGTFKGYIQTICIDKNYRNVGLGKKLLQFCEDRILTVSPNLFICVSSFNQSAIRLYEKFGFKLVGRLENFVKEGFTELLLRKTFGPMIGYKADNQNFGANR